MGALHSETASEGNAMFGLGAMKRVERMLDTVEDGLVESYGKLQAPREVLIDLQGKELRLQLRSYVSTCLPHRPGALTLEQWFEQDAEVSVSYGARINARKWVKAIRQKWGQDVRLHVRGLDGKITSLKA